MSGSRVWGFKYRFVCFFLKTYISWVLRLSSYMFLFFFFYWGFVRVGFTVLGFYESLFVFVTGTFALTGA